MVETSAAGDANSTSQTRKPPLISLAILRRATSNGITSLDGNEVSRRVHAGVLLKDDKKQGKAKNGEYQELPYTGKYWVDEDLNRSCWMVLAKALEITWGDDSRYWRWPKEEEPCYWGNENLPVAELDNVCWLYIKGKCKTTVLSPKTMYKVAIVVKKVRSREKGGWDIPVNLSLELPDGKKQERLERLDRLDRFEEETWIPISIGEFEMTPKTIGEISFSLTQTDGHWKCGLRVKGFVIVPTPGNKQPK